jgi:hypothetical protein
LEAGEFLGVIVKNPGHWTVVPWKENQQFHCFDCKIRCIY